VRDPVGHAFALWDAWQDPGRTRFVRYDGANGERSYLLLWYGDPSHPVVHWVGEAPGDLVLLTEVPPETKIALVPERIVAPLRLRWPGAVSEPVLLLSLPGPPTGPDPPAERCRRLRASDRVRIAEFAESYPDRLTESYRTIDLDRAFAWGAFEGAELVGVARATVALPATWIIGGVYVLAARRRRGHGRDLMVRASRDAILAGARPGLFVREPNRDATRLYESLGYRRVARRGWVEFSPTPGGPGARTGSPVEGP